METKTLPADSLVMLEVDLPETLIAAYAEIARREGRTPHEVMLDALAEYAAHVVATRQATAEPATSAADQPSPTDIEPRFASLGAGESTLDDGYDSTNIKDWIRKTWRPDAHRSVE